METDSLTYRTLKNIAYRFVAYLWPMLFTIFITPIIVFRLGAKEYGIYVFITTVTGLLGLLDLGVSNAVIKFLSGYNAQTDKEKAIRLIRSANSLFLIIGLAGLLGSILVTALGTELWPTRFSNPEYYLTLFTLAGLAFFVGSTNNLYALLPDALQRYDISSKISIASLTVISVANLITVLAGGKLTALLTVQLAIAICFFFIRRRAALNIFPDAKYYLGWDREEVKNCYRYGIATVINNTASSSLTYLDRLIIPIFIGPAQLTYYSLPGNVAARIPGVTDNLSGIIFPISSGLDSQGEREKMERLYIRSVRLVTLIAAAISFSIIFLAEPLLRYWLDQSFADQSTAVLVILVVTNFIIALQSPLNSFFFGLGRLKIASIFSLAMAILNAICLLFLLPRYGILGAAWAYLLSILPTFALIYYFERYELALRRRGRYYLFTISALTITSVIFYGLIRFAVKPLIVDLPTLVIFGPTSVIIYILLYRLLGFFDRDDWVDLLRFTNIAARKILHPFRSR